MKVQENGTTSFRDHFDYSNLMYLMAACLAEKMAGDQSLEEVFSEKLFVPLNMIDTHLITQLNQTDSRFATMYYLDDDAGEFRVLDRQITR